MRTSAFVILATSAVAAPFCDFKNIFGAGAPPYYVTYKLQAGKASSITIDGSLDDEAWKEVPFTDSNPDICGYEDGFCSTAGNCAKGCAKPRFGTRQKVRWDDEYLYVGAELEEPQVWANNTQLQSVIFSDNDYEVFISPDGSNHYYKEYEMNANAVWWDLCLNKPYSDGGYENSTRVFNTTSNPGWNNAGVKTATKVSGCKVNEPSKKNCTGWSLEIAFPLKGLSLNNTNTLPPKSGTYWRINFSRVEWKVRVESQRYYVLDGSCKWPCPNGCPENPGDNWLWAPLGVVDVHQPERWGYLQFSDANPAKGRAGSGSQEAGFVCRSVVEDPDFALRSVAMQLYYAQRSWAATNASAGGGNGSFTDDVAKLAPFAPLGVMALNGSCTKVPAIVLADDAKQYTAHVTAADGKREATITDTRYLLVVDAADHNRHSE